MKLPSYRETNKDKNSHDKTKQRVSVESKEFINVERNEKSPKIRKRDECHEITNRLKKRKHS